MLAGLVAAAALAGGCPDATQAPRLPLRPRTTPILVDVDGDGRADAVSVRYAPAAPAQCAFFLVVATARRPLVARIGEGSLKYGTGVRGRDYVGYSHEPRVGPVVRIAGRTLIVVPRWSGAANVFVTFYALVDGRLRGLAFPRGIAPAESMILSLFGSVGTGTTLADCTTRLLLLEFDTFLTRTKVRRSYAAYRPLGARFVPAATPSQPRIARLPFAHCRVAGPRRL